MTEQITKYRNLLYYLLLFCTSIFIFSCDQADPDFVIEEGRCQFEGINGADGVAEINGINRFLSLRAVKTGDAADGRIFCFTIGGFRPDCSLYEEVCINLLIDRDSIVDGTYDIVSGGAFISNQEIGTVVGDLKTQIEDSFVEESTEFRNGIMTIREVERSRFEIEVEANGPNNPITLQYACPL